MAREIERKGLYAINDVLKLVAEAPNDTFILVDGEAVRITSLKYPMFQEKGTICVNCGVRGAYFALEREAPTQEFHLSLYAVDLYGKEILMTKDHIYPRSRGGEDATHNLDPMCVLCNIEKSDKV